VAKKMKCDFNGKGCGGAFYFLGFVGAIIYYLSTATGFWSGVLGILKSFVWPVFLIYEAMKFMAI
jgi:hypothetical protein